MAFDRLMDQDNSLSSKLSIAEEAFLHCPKCKALFARNIAYCTTDGTKLEEADSTGEKAPTFAAKYELLNEIGSGGMGTVYRVRQILLDKIFALKVIPAESLNDLLITRFQQEAKMMAALDHANLGRIIDFGIDQNQPFMVMEFIDGIPLNKLLSERQPSIEEITDIFCQVLDALAHAHKKGVLHRDVKPSNIMIVQTSPGAQPKYVCGKKAILLDFGIAKKIDADTGMENIKTQALTRTGEMIGSPLYMSPEQCRGEKVTERSDLYSLGCALFESLAGTAPFVGKSTVDTLILHMEKPAPTLKEASLGREFPAGLERVVRKLLSKNPTDRYQSAEETKRALELALTLDDKLFDEQPPKQTLLPFSRTTMLLAVVLLIATVLIIAFSAMQGEKPLPTKTKAFDLDKFQLETALKDAGDRKFINKHQQDVDSIGDEEEDEEDEEAPGNRKPSVYINVRGNEEGLALGGQNLEELRVRLVEQDKKLVRLGLAQAKFPHSMLGKLSGKLQSLRLSAAKINDEDMKNVAKHTGLEKLVLNANPIGDKGVSLLASLHYLDFLDLAHTKCTAKGVYALRALPNLKALYLHNSDWIDDKAAEAASSLVGLHELSLDNTNVTAKGIGYLQHIPMLAILSLGKLKLHDKDLSMLKFMPNLTILRLSKNQITSAGVKHLIPLKHLRSLDLDFNPIDDHAVDALLSLPALRHLSLTGTQMTAKGILKLSALPVLKTIYVRKLDGMSDEVAHEFMSRCRSCQEVVFLTQKDNPYRRADWYLDEKRQAEQKQWRQTRGK